MIMSKDSERQAWTKFVEERERGKKTKQPAVDSFIRDYRLSARGAEAELDDLVTEHTLIRPGNLVRTHRAKCTGDLPIGSRFFKSVPQHYSFAVSLRRAENCRVHRRRAH